MRKQFIFGFFFAMIFVLFAQGCRSTDKDSSSTHYKKTTKKLRSEIIVE